MARMYVREVKDPFLKANELNKVSNRKRLINVAFISSLTLNFILIAYLLLK